MKKKPDKIKAWAVIQENWQENGWPNCLYEQLAAIRGISVFTYAIFPDQRQAKEFKNISEYRKGIKIIPIVLTL